VQQNALARFQELPGEGLLPWRKPTKVCRDNGVFVWTRLYRINES
jgi:hypothetical protein